MRSGALPPERIVGVETGGCPHTAIREDASINLAAVAEMRAKFPDLDLVLIESGGDNLAATFSPELADLTIYVIDVAAGDKIPRKGGPGITRSDLLVINKIDLAPLCRRLARGDGARRQAHARRAAVRVHQSADRAGRRRDRAASSRRRAGSRRSGRRQFAAVRTRPNFARIGSSVTRSIVMSASAAILCACQHGTATRSPGASLLREAALGLDARFAADHRVEVVRGALRRVEAPPAGAE